MRYLDKVHWFNGQMVPLQSIREDYRHFFLNSSGPQQVLFARNTQALTKLDTNPSEDYKNVEKEDDSENVDKTDEESKKC